MLYEMISRNSHVENTYLDIFYYIAVTVNEISSKEGDTLSSHILQTCQNITGNLKTESKTNFYFGTEGRDFVILGFYDNFKSSHDVSEMHSIG